MVKVARRDVKPFQRVCQFFAGKVAKEIVEHAEGKAHFFGVFNIFDGVEGLRSVNKADGAPE
jgi:hypothetical protein